MMYKNLLKKSLILLIMCSVLIAGCSNNKGSNEDKSEVYQIGVGWVDNIIDAHLKLENSPNVLSKEANLEYLRNSVNYFLETLDHATDAEKELLSDYFSMKATEVGKDTKYFLDFGGSK